MTICCLLNTDVSRENESSIKVRYIKKSTKNLNVYSSYTRGKTALIF